MALNRSRVLAVLDEIYAQVPAMQGCDGRCWTSCLGAIGMTDAEHRRIRQAGYRIMDEDQAAALPETHQCEALTVDRRCAVYGVRPLICRLWGTMRSLRCIYGCRPEGGRYLTDEEAYRLLYRAAEVAGHDLLKPGETAEEALRDLLPLLRSRAGRRYMARNTMLDRRLAERAVPHAFRPDQDR